jgi:rhodanese-related sulfurtransferase
MSLSKWFKWLPFGSVPEISAQDLQALIQAGNVQLVDVRTSEEWRRSHIPGAINLPIHHFSKDQVNNLSLQQNKPVVAICLSAHRSVPGVRQLQAMGYSEVFQLAGGMKQWWQQKMPCEENS